MTRRGFLQFLQLYHLWASLSERQQINLHETSVLGVAILAGPCSDDFGLSGDHASKQIWVWAGQAITEGSELSSGRGIKRTSESKHLRERANCTVMPAQPRKGRARSPASLHATPSFLPPRRHPGNVEFQNWGMGDFSQTNQPRSYPTDRRASGHGVAETQERRGE